MPKDYLNAKFLSASWDYIKILSLKEIFLFYLFYVYYYCKNQALIEKNEGNTKNSEKQDQQKRESKD